MNDTKPDRVATLTAALSQDLNESVNAVKQKQSELESLRSKIDQLKGGLYVLNVLKAAQEQEQKAAQEQEQKAAAVAEVASEQANG